jgi:hypothetical protein
MMDDEYRLAWANIEGWTANAKRPARRAAKPLDVRFRNE